MNCHKLIVAHGSDKLRKLINNTEQRDKTSALHLNDENFDLFQEIVEFLYTGSCPSLGTNDFDRNIDSNRMESYDSEESLDELSWSLEEIGFEDLDNLDLSPERVGMQEERMVVVEEKARKKNMDLKGQVLVDPSRRKDLLHVAKKYKIEALVAK